MRRNEHGHIASRGFMKVEESNVRAGQADAVDELADEYAISHKQRVLHGAGGDFERLDDEGTHESENQYDTDYDGPKVFPCHCLLKPSPS